MTTDIKTKPVVVEIGRQCLVISSEGCKEHDGMTVGERAVLMTIINHGGTVPSLRSVAEELNMKYWWAMLCLERLEVRKFIQVSRPNFPHNGLIIKALVNLLEREP